MDDTALRDEIRRARVDHAAAYDAVSRTPEHDDVYQERYTAWREASARYDALIRAGVLLTLGPLEDDCENTG